MVVYQKHDVALNEVGSRDVLECSITKDPVGWRNHSEERSHRLGFLQLVKFDEGVEKCDSDENAAEISVLYVILWRSVNKRKKKSYRGASRLT
jgi:hypothetical protein